MSTATTDAEENFAPPPPRSRWKWVRKLALWLLAFVAVVLFVALVGRWQVGRMGERQLQVATARLDADDPAWQLDPLLEARKKAAPLDAENAALAVLDLADRVPDDWRKWRNSEEAMAFWSRRSDNHLPAQEAIDAARKRAADTFLLRTQAIRLRDRHAGQFTLTIAADPLTSKLPHLDSCRVLISLLQYDALLSTLDKNPNRGISAARAMLAVGRAIGDEPLLVSQLVRTACGSLAAQTAMQVFAWGEPTDGLAELQAELLAEADFPYFLTGIRGERAVIDKLFRGLEDGTIPPEHWFTYMGIQNPGPEHYAAFRAYRPLIPGDHAKALEIFTAHLDATKLPLHEQLPAMQAIPIPKGQPEEFRYLMTSKLLPAYEKLAESGLRCRAGMLTAATCVACERFRMKHKRFPRELAELVPEFLPAVPVSPFDGQSISFRTHPDRIVVDCHWPKNPLQADAGPADFRPEGRPGSGIGYRVWIVEQRGLPAEKREGKQNP